MTDHDSKLGADAEEVVRSMGLVFNNTALYSAKHSVTKQSLDSCYAAVSSILARRGELSIVLADDAVSVNGQSVDLKNPLMRMFVQHLTALEISAFSLAKEMSKEKFAQLMDVLNSKPAELKQFGGFAAAVENFHLDGVKAKHVTFRQIEDDEVVVTKDQMQELSDKASEGGNTEAIVAFLKGEVDADETVQGMRDIASDASTLSELIMKAAEVKEKAMDLSSGESMADVVIGCLRRCYDGLAGDDACKTLKGKKELKKTLLLLEKEIVDKMHEFAGAFTADDEALIADAVEQMQDELEIETLAAEYMKKRNAIENNEKRILRFIQVKGLDKVAGTDLQEKLSEGGLDTAGWNELLVKSGIAAAAAAGGGLGIGKGGGMGAIGQLAMMLERIEKDIEYDREKVVMDQKSKEELAGLLHTADKEVRHLVSLTERKISNLVEQVGHEDAEEMGGKAGADAPKKQSSRKKLLAVLAEIVQEFCQPLAVVNCSLHMLLSGNMGSVSEEQIDILKLANESGERLQKLIDHLMGIAGVPDTMQPDAEVQKSIYG